MRKEETKEKSSKT